MKFIDSFCRRHLKRRGYNVTKYINTSKSDYALLDYVDKSGNFDYQRYVDVQTIGNKNKINNIWADEKTIDLICDYLRTSGVSLRRGLCHGSRNGAEVRWFKERLGIEVVGTDISETATDFGLVKWDFHEVNPEWLGQFDFIYTNSHDHAYDPKKAFDAWVDQLAPGGKLIIEHTGGHSAEAVTELDPFGIDARLLPYVVLNFSEGKYAVVRILKPQHGKAAKKGSLPIWVFIIARL